MKYGCCITIDDYELAVELGFDYIELAGKEVCSYDDKEFSKLVDKIRSGKIPCLGFNAYCSPEITIAGPKFDVKKAMQYASFCAVRAAELGVKKIGIGSPNSRNLPEDFNRKLAVEQAVLFFKVTAEEFAKHSITVCVEALGKCYCNFINYLDEAVDLTEKINMPNVKIVLDFYNMEHENEADIDLKPILPYIAHTHISDDDNSPLKRYFLKPEKSHVHLKRIRQLKQLGYDDTISLEVDLPINDVLASQSLALLKQACK
jgi:sugar phosphate isomerase/epimerase